MPSSGAAGDVIVIASAHVYPVYRDWLEQLLVHLRDPKADIVCVAAISIAC